MTKTLRVRTGRKQATRAQDREAVAQSKLDRVPSGLWAEIREDFPEAHREKGDALLRAGTLNLIDVAATEVAEHAWLGEMINEIKAGIGEEGAAGYSTMVKFFAARKQCRNHQRLIAQLIGPPLKTGDQPVTPPAGYDLEGFNERKRQRAEREAAGESQEILN